MTSNEHQRKAMRTLNPSPDIPREGILQANIAKFKQRFPEGFSAEKSPARADEK